jgi:dihydroxyacetone kinase
VKKLINAPRDVVPEMLEGLCAVYPGLARLEGHSVLLRADAPQVKDAQVALVSGGGSGHEPAHAGYVGAGMLSAAVAGDVFTSPSTDAVAAALRATASRHGALLIIKNYTGDRLNFGLAAELVRGEGIPVETVIVADDVALSASTEHAGRRGLAGTVLIHKIAGAAAAAGADLAAVTAEADQAAGAVRTMGVALSACTVPAAGRPGFTLGEAEIELGLGIHGEAGVQRDVMSSADHLVDKLLSPICSDLELTGGDRVVVLVNNLGGSTTMELAIVARHAIATLEAKGIRVERAYAGTFLSALEMAGVSLTVMRVDDARLARLDAPTSAPAWPAMANLPRRGSTVIPAPVSTAAPRGSAGTPLAAVLKRVADALTAAESILTEMDQVVGDGDLGASLTRGAEAMRAHLDTFPADSAATLHALSQVVARALGGTSGPLYSAFLLRASRNLAGPSPLAAWAQAFSAGCAAVMELGGAKAGDRTMLDALLPAAAALESAATRGASPTEALSAAVAAARAGAEATRHMSPRRGRSSYLGQRVLGHVDPGAHAVGIWLSAISGK